MNLMPSVLPRRQTHIRICGEIFMATGESMLYRLNEADISIPDGWLDRSVNNFLLPAGAEMAKGHNAIEAFWRGAVKQLGDAKLTTVDIQSLGPGAAREIGTFSFKTKAQPPEPVTGKYVVVWRKMGGQWQLATDIWNMNK